MSLTRRQFDVLEILASENEGLSQRQLEEKTGCSLGTVNRIIKQLSDLNYQRSLF